MLVAFTSIGARVGDSQVVVRRAAERRAIAALPGVATVALPSSSYGDVVLSQGVARTGASALSDVAANGAGLRIAVLDLGFGSSLAPLQASGELPPASRLVQRSFDPAAGIYGTNAYGNLTDHGQLVAQTIYDYAPRATYLFVNYHTPDDFVAAVDWLATQHVDVVVHSNNFLDGPFDGTSAPARAVDRAAAAGILWFNSAGNYGEKHWGGPWVDADGDRVLDWPGTQPWTLIHEANQALTFHLSWTNPVGAPKSDVDLFLEQRQPDGSWKAIASSTDKQLEGAPPSERINGVRPSVAGEFRLRAVLVSGPPPAGTLSLYSREDDILSWSGSTFGSVPTPADAAGSISIAAVDFRGNSLARYSSRGPTADGRLKPTSPHPPEPALRTQWGIPGMWAERRSQPPTPQVPQPSPWARCAPLRSASNRRRDAGAPDTRCDRSGRSRPGCPRFAPAGSASIRSLRSCVRSSDSRVDRCVPPQHSPSKRRMPDRS